MLKTMLKTNVPNFNGQINSLHFLPFLIQIFVSICNKSGLYFIILKLNKFLENNLFLSRHKVSKNLKVEVYDYNLCILIFT